MPNNPVVEAKRPGGAYGYYVVFILMLAYVCSFIDRTILGLLIEPIKADMALGDFEISLLAGFGFAVFYTALGIPFGWLADRSNRIGIVFWGVISWSVMTAACGFSRTFGGLLFARMGVGVGEATLSPASYSLIPDLFPKEKLGLAGSIYASGLTIGGGLAMMLGGAAVQTFARLGTVNVPLLGIFKPWQAAFLFVGLLGLPVATLILALRDPRHGKAVQASLAKAGVGETMGYIWERRGAFVPILLGYGFMVIVNYALVIWVPTYFIRAHAMNPAQVGLAMGSLMLFAGTPGLIAGGLVSDWLMRRGYKDAPVRVVLFSVISQAPFFIGAVLADSTPLALGLMGIAVFLITLNGGLQGATFQILAPGRMHGQTVATYLVVANAISLGIGPILTGLITDKVLGDPARIGESLAITAALSLGVALVLILVAMPRVKAQVLSV